MTHDNDLIRRGDALALVGEWESMWNETAKAVLKLPAVAASQPADSVINADSCQRVTVKPLVWDGLVCVTEYKYCLSYWEKEDEFVDSYTTMRRHPTLEAAKAAAQADYATRILAALDVQPDTRDEVIARLVEAAKALEMWDAARGYPVPYRVRDPLRAALAAVKGCDA